MFTYMETYSSVESTLRERFQHSEERVVRTFSLVTSRAQGQRQRGHPISRRHRGKTISHEMVQRARKLLQFESTRRERFQHPEERVVRTVSVVHLKGARTAGCKEATQLVADTEGKLYHRRWFNAPAKATRSYKGHPPPSAMLIYKPNHSYPASAHVEDPALVQVHPDHRATGKIPIEQPFVKPGGGKGTPTQGPPKRKRLRKDKEACELMETEFCVECTEECMSCDSPRITTSAYFTNRVAVILSATSSHVVCQTNLYPKGARS